MKKFRQLLFLLLVVCEAFAQAKAPQITNTLPPNPGNAKAIYFHTKMDTKIFVDKDIALIAVNKGELIAKSISSCSNAQYRCVNIDSTLFAVPKTGLRSGQRFAFNGMNFVVLSCIDVDGLCRVSEIAGECGNNYSQKALCGLKENGSIIRFDKICFIYSNENGLVYFSFPKIIKDSCANSGGGYLLVSGRWNFL